MPNWYLPVSLFGPFSFDKRAQTCPLKKHGCTRERAFAARTEVTISIVIKRILTAAGIALFRAIRWTKRRLDRIFGRGGRLFLPLGRLVQRGIIMPVYSTIVLFKLRLRRFALPTRGLAIFLIGNRYLFHAVFIIAAGATVLLNLRTPYAYAQDVGRGSLLYAIVAQPTLEIIEEGATTGTIHPSASYLGADTIIAIPHIDFDYDEGERTLSSIAVPGAIRAPIIYDTDSDSKAPRTKTESYVVQEGDTIGSIARDFNVNIGTILWSNNLTERQYIRPGEILKVPPVSGVLVTVKSGDTVARLASRYEASEDEIIAFNKIRNESSITVGTELMIPGGKPPAVVSTIAVARTRTTETVPTNIPKPPDAPATGGATLLWPTPGRVITQYYGWRHTGLDIDGDFTSPLYASEEGVVTTAGWNSGGYGLQIVVKHPNGMMTRYAHASKLFVKVGDYVSRGQTIAIMGSTGRSTGSHLHYEVYIGSRRANPLHYIR